MEQKDKANEERRFLYEKIEEKNNEINGLSIQQENLVDQLNDANHEFFNLRTENEILENDLNMEKKTNERMMKSQESMNELDRQIQSRYKSTIGLGYTDEGESS